MQSITNSLYTYFPSLRYDKIDLLPKEPTSIEAEVASKLLNPQEYIAFFSAKIVCFTEEWKKRR